jgi:CRP-like cAMP-binding protein
MDADADSAAGRYRSGNALIDALPNADYDFIARHLTVFYAEVPSCVVSRGSPFEDVLFPIDALFSITAQLHHGDAYEVAAIGRGGLVGAELALGIDTAPRSVLAQIEGNAARMSRADFLRCFDRSTALARAVHRHFVRRLYIAEQFVACAFAHDATQRFARWALMLRDEVGRTRFELREEFLGMMLGLNPQSAAAVARPLEKMGIVHYVDETLSIVDDERLRELSCECYSVQRQFASKAL